MAFAVLLRLYTVALRTRFRARRMGNRGLDRGTRLPARHRLAGRPHRGPAGPGRRGVPPPDGRLRGRRDAGFHRSGHRELRRGRAI